MSIDIHCGTPSLWSHYLLVITKVYIIRTNKHNLIAIFVRMIYTINHRKGLSIRVNDNIIKIVKEGKTLANKT